RTKCPGRAARARSSKPWRLAARYSSGRFVGLDDQRLGTLQIIVGSQSDLEVASPEMANVAYVSGEARLQLQGVWIQLQVNANHIQRRLDFDASEILDPSEGDVEAQCLLSDIVT